MIRKLLSKIAALLGRGETEPDFDPKPRPLCVDPDAKSADGDLPAFMARPEGEPVYYGFVILDDVEVDRFKLGMITDFESSPRDGDAFVVAPDDTRAGLVWDVGEYQGLEEVCPIEAGRWGVWGVSFPEPMEDKQAMTRNLAFILPDLKEKYKIWLRKHIVGSKNRE